MSLPTLVFHPNLASILSAYRNQTDKAMFVDLSDGGELGIRLGLSLNTLTLFHVTVKEYLLPTSANGRGLFQIWDSFDPDIVHANNGMIFSDPLRMLDLHLVATLETAHGVDTLYKTFNSFYRWLRQKGFVRCHVLTSRVPTALYKCITQDRNEKNII